ncbi:MAG: hypothetical protein HY721_21805 [Planctomycetes bacterium]|nr:hypothetical protein [Planctomycetota bacterium]
MVNPAEILGAHPGEGEETASLEARARKILNLRPGCIPLVDIHRYGCGLARPTAAEEAHISQCDVCQSLLEKSRTMDAAQPTHLRVTFGELRRPGASSQEDAARLVRGCLEAIEDLEQFPPKLFVLWATQSFEPYGPLLGAVRAELEERRLGGVPLVGASVAACLFAGGVHEEGAVLVCLSSRLLWCEAALALETAMDAAEAAGALLKRLPLDGGAEPHGDPFLIAFVPGGWGGPRELAPGPFELARELDRQTHHKLDVWGGASASSERHPRGAQFFGDGVHEGAVVAALVSAHVGHGIGLEGGRAPAAHEGGAEASLHTCLEGGRTRWILEEAGLEPAKVVASLTIGSPATLQGAELRGLEALDALPDAGGRSSAAQRIGCILDWPLGIRRQGGPPRSDLGTSRLVLSDEVPEGAGETLLAQALAEYVRSPATGPLRATMCTALRCILSAGYPAAMISLIYQDHEKEWIVARAAKGRLWERDVLPHTCRDRESMDVLACVVRDKTPRFVRDSRTDPSCDQELARCGGVISQYVQALLDIDGSVFGVLQIDLGDRRGPGFLSSHEEGRLAILGRLAGDAVSRALRAEELDLSRRLGKLLQACESRTLTDEEAAARWVVETAKLLGASAAHVRLWDAGERVLRLVGGYGAYYDAAKERRKDVTLWEGSGSAICASTGRPLIVNELAKDSRSLEILERCTSAGRSVLIGNLLELFGSCGAFPISERHGEPLGVFNIASGERWFFTRWRLRLLEDMRERLAGCLARIRRHNVEGSWSSVLCTTEKAASTVILRVANLRDRILQLSGMNGRLRELSILDECRRELDGLARLLESLEKSREREIHARDSQHRLDLLIFEVLEDYVTFAGTKGIEMRFQPSEDIASINGSVFRECISTLVDHAIESMPDGGRLDVRMVRATGATRSGSCKLVIAHRGRRPRASDLDDFRKGRLDPSGFSAIRHFVSLYGGAFSVKPGRKAGLRTTMLLPIKCDARALEGGSRGMESLDWSTVPRGPLGVLLEGRKALGQQLLVGGLPCGAEYGRTLQIAARDE